MQICSTASQLSESFDCDKAFQELTDRINAEPTLLNCCAEELLGQFRSGLSCIVILEERIVGHMTIRHVDENWYEIGSTWVHRDARGSGLYGKMFTAIEEDHPEKFLFGKSISPVARFAGRKYLVPVLRSCVPCAACGKCSGERMRASSPEECKRAWGEEQCNSLRGPEADACVFRVSKRTFSSALGLSKVILPEDS